MEKEQLLKPIAKVVKNGTPYIGWSAGTNLACPTIKTTNDMPVVYPKSLNALHLIEYQVNPHYTDQRIPNHGGESREERIGEFLFKNKDATVFGLREGSIIEVKKNVFMLHGNHTVRVFKYAHAPFEADGFGFL
ncbi:MAG: dipeptidase PepE [Bacteroidales bacterium]|nr:dipeptidase PepE [Bacteroidales bacterium]